MPDDVMEIYAIVKGRVQGVGFRFFAERTAEKFSVNGWVRNLPNGDVEILGQGTKEQLEKFIAHIRQGPRSSMVVDIETVWRSPTRIYEYFSITY